MQYLLERAGFCIWGPEDLAPGHPTGTIDWSCDYTDEMNWFVHQLVRECAAVAANCQGGYKAQVYDAVVNHWLVPEPEVEGEGDEWDGEW